MPANSSRETLKRVIVGSKQAIIIPVSGDKFLNILVRDAEVWWLAAKVKAVG
jgi:hypothetical protein